MLEHKFHVGQTVHFVQKDWVRVAPLGGYRVVRLLPAEEGEFQYRIKSTGDGQERVVRESQIGDQMTVEALAQALYEDTNDSGVPWARRDRTVRDAWLEAARRRIADLGSETT